MEGKMGKSVSGRCLWQQMSGSVASGINASQRTERETAVPPSLADSRSEKWCPAHPSGCFTTSPQILGEEGRMEWGIGNPC